MRAPLRGLRAYVRRNHPGLVRARVLPGLAILLLMLVIQIVWGLSVPLPGLRSIDLELPGAVQVEVGLAIFVWSWDSIRSSPWNGAGQRTREVLTVIVLAILFLSGLGIGAQVRDERVLHAVGPEAVRTRICEAQRLASGLDRDLYWADEYHSAESFQCMLDQPACEPGETAATGAWTIAFREGSGPADWTGVWARSFPDADRRELVAASRAMLGCRNQWHVAHVLGPLHLLQFLLCAAFVSHQRVGGGQIPYRRQVAGAAAVGVFVGGPVLWWFRLVQIGAEFSPIGLGIGLACAALVVFGTWRFSTRQSVLASGAAGFAFMALFTLALPAYLDASRQVSPLVLVIGCQVVWLAIARPHLDTRPG